MKTINLWGIKNGSFALFPTVIWNFDVKEINITWLFWGINIDYWRE